MTRLKKTLAALLAAACLASIVPSAFAADSRTFSDAPADAPYASAVEYVVEQGLMSGTSVTTFNPDGPLTRAILATVLYRAVGEPTVYSSSGFADVPAGGIPMP